jgi:large subunit ribosomal protein L19
LQGLSQMKSQKITSETILRLGVNERNFPAFKVGDTVRVNQIVKEGDKERVQAFEGDVISSRNNGISSTFTVRKIGANAVAVERIYPYYSPAIESVVIVRRGDIRRAQAYYVRSRVGRAAKFKEKILTKAQKAELSAKNA